MSRSNCLGNTLENPFPCPHLPFFFLFFFFLNENQKGFQENTKPNMAMQHSREFVLETHISNAKLTSSLSERRRETSENKRRKNHPQENQSVCISFDVLLRENRKDVRHRETGTFSACEGLEKSRFDLWVIWCTDAKSGAFVDFCSSPWPSSAWAAELGQGGWQAEIGLSATLTLCFLYSSLN